MHWYKKKVKFQYFNNNNDKDQIKKQILIDANVPKSKGKYCYRLRLKKKINYNYVGMTGLHPYERYLNHLLGIKSSRYAKNLATALIEFEGPMRNDEAIIREIEWGKELEKKGFIVEGPKPSKNVK